MVESGKEFVPPATGSCLYGDADYTNRTVFEYHAVSLVTTIAMACLLLFNGNLRRFYTPLARIVNICLILQLFSDGAFFAYYPYEENQGNCTEKIIGRIFTALIMFGELHQVYLLANMLGLGKYQLQLFNGSISLSLDGILQIGTVLLIITTIYAIINQQSFMMSRNLWCIVASSLQIYFVHLSNTMKHEVNNNILNSSSSSVRIFDKLSKLQLLPGFICFIERVLENTGVIPYNAALRGITLSLSQIIYLLFYLKVLLIKENADLNIEMVDV